MLAAGA